MSTEALFGTDGIRGPSGEAPLDRSTLRRLGRALGHFLSLQAAPGPVLLAGDTRASTPDICHWLAEGLASSGVQTVYGGVLPTPAVSRLVPELRLPLGIAVSASHNPYPDNGVKLIGADGSKWKTESEIKIERLLETIEPDIDFTTPELEVDTSLRQTYLDLLTADVIGPRPLEGLRVCLDCANGAATELAPELFTKLGAVIEVLGDQPNGRNINAACGSTEPSAMAARTVSSASQIGFAFDGDADRVIVADETGTVRDGDSILFLLATRLRGQGKLDPARIVATTMSNLGLQVALSREGIEIVRCDVGDRIVVETLRRQGLLLGGEQSGHIIHLGLGPTGDGLQTALLMAQALVADDRPVSAQLARFRTFPQILVNVPVSRKPDLLSLPPVEATAAEVTRSLGDQGRLVLRYSGTEPLARIMIEGPDQQEVEALASRLATVIHAEIGTES